jgi:hypothetical protein
MNQVEYGAGFGYLQEEQGTVPIRLMSRDSIALLSQPQYLQENTSVMIELV